MKLLETWVKAPFLRETSLLLVGECVQAVYPNVYEEFARRRVVLTGCPETEHVGQITGKLASIIACSSPKEITVLTVEGSPHCFTLHAAVNETLFVTRASVPSKHYVILDGKAIDVGSESVRVGRYLHLVQKCIQKLPEILEELRTHSLEHRCYLK